MQVLILSCTIISIIISIFAISLSLIAIIKVEALNKSTHKIEWLPIKNPYENKEEDLEEFGADPMSET